MAVYTQLFGVTLTKLKDMSRSYFTLNSKGKNVIHHHFFFLLKGNEICIYNHQYYLH